MIAFRVRDSSGKPGVRHPADEDLQPRLGGRGKLLARRRHPERSKAESKDEPERPKDLPELLQYSGTRKCQDQ